MAYLNGMLGPHVVPITMRLQHHVPVVCLIQAFLS